MHVLQCLGKPDSRQAVSSSPSQEELGFLVRVPQKQTLRQGSACKQFIREVGSGNTDGW